MRNNTKIRFKKVITRNLLLVAIGIIGVLFGSNIRMHTIANAATQKERESNDSYATANTVILGNSVSGTLSSSDDVDYYKLMPTANGKIELDFCHTYLDHYSYWRVSTYIYKNGEYTELSNWEIGLQDKEKESIPYIGVVKNGVYYVKVERSYDTYVVGENYTIQTKFTSSDYFEKEENDAYASATDMKANHSYNGIINSNSDKDYYKIVASQNGKIQLNFCHTYVDRYSFWRVRTYIYENGEYIELSNREIGLQDKEKESIPYIGVVKNGVYYIKVERSYETYVVGENYTIQTRFTASDYYEKEKNDSYASATNMNINKSYNGTINNSNDKDYYKIVAPENGILILQFAHGYKDVSKAWNVSGYQYKNGEYRELFGDSIWINSTTKKHYAYLEVTKKGIYYVKVERSYGSIEGENYNLKGSFYADFPGNFNIKVKKNKATLTWTKANSVTGYEIYYKKGKKGTYKKLTTTTKTNYVFKKLTKGTVYYFKVRSYKKSGNHTYYSPYTNVKSAKYK